jgi:putative protease
LGKKIYVTVNIFAKNADFEEIKKYVIFLQNADVDAVIVSDLGAMKIVRENTDLEIHVSTQANICNKYTAEEYVNLGAKRVILARELPLNDIAEIAEHLAGRAEVEVFVHGAMCMAYSGRCMLSNYMTGRSANRGDCAQPCRYKYALCEEKRPNEFYPIEQDKNGTYIMNSRDLCLINHLKELKNAGVKSIKIEGRMKSEYYVGGTVNAYRRALDGEKLDFIAELNKISHRPWTAGFTFSDKNMEFTDRAGQEQTYEVAAIALGDGRVVQKNKFSIGDELEILSPNENFNKTFTAAVSSNLPESIIEMKCPYKLNEYDIIRKAINTKHS